jgi:hypothetical protein
LALQGAVKDEASNCEVMMIARNGSIPVPIHLVLEYADGTKETVHHSAAIWKDGKQHFKVFCQAGKKLKSATLGLRTIPDAEPDDNTWAR